MLPDYIDGIADKTCNSSTPVQNRQKMSFAHRNGSLWFIVQASENHSSVEALHAVYTGASSHHVKGKLSLSESSRFCRI